jgi:hypothetical protein
MIQIRSAIYRRFIFSLLFSICLGLFLAQWQGFTHGVHHAHEQHEKFNQGGPVAEEADGDYRQKHHCAAYDSLTLSFALTFHLAPLPQIDAQHQLPRAYQAYQASIKPNSSFEARAPPAQHV